MFIILGAILVAVALWSLFSGKVVAGSRGVRANYYRRREAPVLYYLFISLYFFIGIITLVYGWK